MARATQNPPIKLGVLISGSGRTLANFLELIRKRFLTASVEAVVSSRADVAGVERARAAGIPCEVIEKKGRDVSEFSKLVTAALDKHKPDLVLMAGWLCLYEIPEHYRNRVMNIHPALLPNFGGKGMYGRKVHDAVLASGVKLSGCTVHFATDEYDRGPIIVQRACPVLENDTADTLADRVFAQECIAYPSAVRLFAQNRLTVADGRVRIGPDRTETRDCYKLLDDE